MEAMLKEMVKERQLRETGRERVLRYREEGLTWFKAAEESFIDGQITSGALVRIKEAYYDKVE